MNTNQTPRENPVVAAARARNRANGTMAVAVETLTRKGGPAVATRAL